LHPIQILLLGLADLARHCWQLLLRQVHRALRSCGLQARIIG
jgi:hypothetical protein